MGVSNLSLPRQVDAVFHKLGPELLQLSAGTIVIHIREDNIGKFGIVHNPIEVREGQMDEYYGDQGLTKLQVEQFRRMAVDSLKYKRNWTHGELSFDFVCRRGTWSASILFKSNYNMATLLDTIQ